MRLGDLIMVKKIIDGYCLGISWLIAAMMAVMVVLVFGNVFLRYGFNSGITMSEELSRWLFVWMTFLGAIVALRERGHLGTDMLISRLGPKGKKVCLFVSYVLMIYVCYLLFKGAWAQAVINWTTTSAVMEVPMSWIYFPGILCAVLGGLILLVDLFDLVTGRIRDDGLVMFQESEEKPHTHAGDAR
jgi:TRAP-type transport system small permease protein